MKKKIFIGCLGVAAAMLAVWFSLSPFGRFGPSFYAFTVYNAIPIPLTDIQVNSEGEFRRVKKTHDLSMNPLRWLIESKPEVLIVSLGWSGVVKPRDEVLALERQGARFLRNDEAIKLYNELKKAGRRVAIHFHSTC